MPTRSAIQTVPRLPRTVVVGIGLWLLSVFLLGIGGSDTWAYWTVGVLTTVVAGWNVARAAWRALRLASYDMHVLMTIASLGAIATGDVLEAASTMVLFGVALWLERASVARSHDAVHALMTFAPTVAHVLHGDHVHDVDPQHVRVGDRLLIRPGERLPLDGVLEHGDASLDESPISGESVPVDKSPGERVFAGSLNRDGAITIRASKIAADSTVAHIGRLVEEAQASRSPTQRFVDRFALWYTPLVLVIAALLVIVPPLLFAQPWGLWLHRGLVLLVIACPCALVLSTPITIACGLQYAARRGVLIKGGEWLELAGRIDAVAFDKTGTLTQGRPAVVAVEGWGNAASSRVVQVAASLEHASEHPLARAIVQRAQQERLPLLKVEQFVARRGLGVRGTIEGQTYLIGNARWLIEQGVDAAQLEAATNPDHAQVFVAQADKLLGFILLDDPLHGEAPQAVQELRSLGVRHVVLLTGDRRTVAERVARLSGIEEWRADLLPEDKVAELATLRAQYPRLAMVGDGINDAPALAAAPLGIALGAGASDTAWQSANIIVMSSHIRRVGEIVQLGRRTLQLLRQNVALALLIKSLTMLAAAAGLANMWMAVAADVGASLLVIFNGMRLLRVPSRSLVSRDAQRSASS